LEASKKNQCWSCSVQGSVCVRMMRSVEWSNHPEMGTPLSVLCSKGGIPIANKEFNENVVSSAINKR